MKQHVIFFSFFFAFILAASPTISKRYRSDYVYNKNTDAFYKLHIESDTIWSAKDVCEIEGAKLMVPSSQKDVIQFHALFKKYPDLGEYVWVDDDGLTHDSAEVQAIINFSSEDEEIFNHDIIPCNIMTRKGEVRSYSCREKLPFICKVDAKDAPYDPICDVYGTGYSKITSKSGSCYKVPVSPYSWNEAKAECEAEGAHLVILNSQKEHDEVKYLMETTPTVYGAETPLFFFAGFRANKPTDGSPRVFKTIFNQTLAEAGFEQWAKDQPDNYLNSEYCGSLYKNNGNLNDIECSKIMAYICEKEMHL